MLSIQGYELDTETLDRIERIMGDRRPDPTAACRGAYEIGDRDTWQEWYYLKPRRTRAVERGLDFISLFERLVSRVEVFGPERHENGETSGSRPGEA